MRSHQHGVLWVSSKQSRPVISSAIYIYIDVSLSFTTNPNTAVHTKSSAYAMEPSSPLRWPSDPDSSEEGECVSSHSEDSIPPSTDSSPPLSYDPRDDEETPPASDSDNCTAEIEAAYASDAGFPYATEDEDEDEEAPPHMEAQNEGKEEDHPAAQKKV